jgi:hypothetical protein
MNNKVYAEDVNYYQTSTTAADTWIDKAKKEIARIGGRVKASAFGEDDSGRAAFMMLFQIGEDAFRISWAVLPQRKANERAAKIQAATMLYHDVKHKVVMAKVKGVKTAFMEYWLLPDGRTAAEATNVDLMKAMPILLPAPK